MLSTARKVFVVLLVIVLTGACAVIRPPEKKRVPYPAGPIVPGVPSDEDLFLLGTSYLGNAELHPDYLMPAWRLKSWSRPIPAAGGGRPRRSLSGSLMNSRQCRRTALPETRARIRSSL